MTQATVEKLEGLERKVSVTVPKENVAEKYQEKLQEVIKTVQIKGFRPGKAPIHLIESRFGRDILSEVAGELVESSLTEVFQKHQIQPVARPQIKPGELAKNNPFQYDATFEVFPEIHLQDLAGVIIYKLEAEITENDVAHELESIRKEHGEWIETTRKAEKGDQLLLDYEVHTEGNPVHDMKGEKISWELNESLLPELITGLLGVQANDAREIAVKFPEDNQSKEIAGKNAVFKLKIHAVHEKKLPPLDNEFAQKLGIQEGGIESLKAEIRKNLEMKLKQGAEQNTRNQILNKLLELNQIEIPKALVEKEIEHLQHQRRQLLSQYTRTQEPLKWDLPRDPFVTEAERRVRLGLLFSEVIKVHKIKIDESKVVDKIREIASTYKNPDKIMETYMHDETLRSDVQSYVLEHQVIDYLMKQLKIETKKASYDEVMQSAQANQ